MLRRFRPLAGLYRPRWLGWGLCAAGWPWLASGCAQPHDVLTGSPSLPLSTTLSGSPTLPELQRVLYEEKKAEEKKGEEEKKKEGPDLPPPPLIPGKPLPIELETVLRLAEEQNPEIARTRAQLHESQMESQAAYGAWLPKVYAGIAYYRHEGGIQNPDGTFVSSSTGALFPGLNICSELDFKNAIAKQVDACRKVWQQKGEVSKMTNDKLLEAATTYIDLLTARRAEAVWHLLEQYEVQALERTQNLVKAGEVTARALVEAAEAQVSGRRQGIVKLKQQGDAAAYKLAYLLGLPCDVPLVPMEAVLAPIELVDVTPPCSALVAQALTTGPGVRELQGMLATIQCGMAQLQGPVSLLPTIQVNMFEGPFGAGTGANLTWDNRFDLGVQMRWNLTELLGAHQQQALAHNRLMQVQLSYQELRNKLTSGVQEARDAVLAGRVQLGIGGETIRHASEAYRLSDLRIKEHVPGATISDVLQSIRVLESAHHEYLNVISSYNKAQIRLLLFLGPGATKGHAEKPGVPPGVPANLPPVGEGPRSEVDLKPVPAGQAARKPDAEGR